MNYANPCQLVSSGLFLERPGDLGLSCTPRHGNKSPALGIKSIVNIRQAIPGSGDNFLHIPGFTKSSHSLEMKISPPGRRVISRSWPEVHGPAFCERKGTISVVFLSQVKLLYRKFFEEVQDWAQHKSESQDFIHVLPFSPPGKPLKLPLRLELLHINPSSGRLRTDDCPFPPPVCCNNKLF